MYTHLMGMDCIQKYQYPVRKLHSQFTAYAYTAQDALLLES